MVGRKGLGYVRFGSEAARNREFVRSWEKDGVVTSTWRQLNDQWDYKAHRTVDSPPLVSELAATGDAPFCSVAISESGIAALDLPGGLRPTDGAFTTTMEWPTFVKNYRICRSALMARRTIRGATMSMFKGLIWSHWSLTHTWTVWPHSC